MNKFKNFLQNFGIKETFEKIKDIVKMVLYQQLIHFILE